MYRINLSWCIFLHIYHLTGYRGRWSPIYIGPVPPLLSQEAEKLVKSQQLRHSEKGWAELVIYIYFRKIWILDTSQLFHFRTFGVAGHWQSINRIKKFPLERDPGLGPSIMIGIFHFIRKGNKYRNFVIYNKLCWIFFYFCIKMERKSP